MMIYEQTKYAHLHTMAKTSVKFQNDWPKIVAVALTRHPLSIVDERTDHGTSISHLHATQVQQKTQIITKMQ